jgi:hypothetical protein
MASIRLSPEQEQKLEAVCAAQGASKSEIIKRALDQFLTDYEASLSPFELGRDLFGKYGSGREDLSRTYKSRLKDKLREKHAH